MSGWTRHTQREVYSVAKIERLDGMRATTTYNGIPTRRATRIAQLEKNHQRLCFLGWNPAHFPPSLRRVLEGGL